VVGTHLAKVLAGGGEFTSPQRVSEQYLLDLEGRDILAATADGVLHAIRYSILYVNESISYTL